MTENGLLENRDCKTIKPFDREWERASQSKQSPFELKALLSASCLIFPLDHVLAISEEFHIGFSFCRREMLVAPWVGCSPSVLQYNPGYIRCVRSLYAHDQV